MLAHCSLPSGQPHSRSVLLDILHTTKIKTKVVTRDVINVDWHVGHYIVAINRLNIVVVELKAKLVSKLGVEGDIAKQK